MNRGAFQSSSSLYQLLGGSPAAGLWNLDNMGQISNTAHPQQTYPLLPSSSPSSSSSSSVLPQYSQPLNLQAMAPWLHNQKQLPESWNQLLLGGLIEDENRCSFAPFQTKKMMQNWEDQVIYPSEGARLSVDIKQELTDKAGYIFGQTRQEIQAPRSSWSQVLPNSSPRSCITTSFNSSMLDFTNSKAEARHQQLDHSTQECNSTPTGPPHKKARVQTTSAQPTFKVRKEKLGDRITALHQLVSPFGKTDTASVLLEAIGYIRFLQSQIEALSSPYLAPASPANMKQHPSDGTEHEAKKDLRSRGLCLVPASFTLHVGSDNGADYWAPTFGGGFQ